MALCAVWIVWMDSVTSLLHKLTPYTEYPFLGFASLQPLLIRLIRKNNFVVCRTALSASLLAVKKMILPKNENEFYQKNSQFLVLEIQQSFRNVNFSGNKTRSLLVNEIINSRLPE